MKLMNSFEVLSGKHFSKGPGRKIKKYVKGDIVKSPRNLEKIFPNKFRLVVGEVKETTEPTGLKLFSLGKGQYDVIGLEGDKINKEPLTKSEAEALVSE